MPDWAVSACPAGASHRTVACCVRLIVMVFLELDYCVWLLVTAGISLCLVQAPVQLIYPAGPRLRPSAVPLNALIWNSEPYLEHF